MAAAIDAAAAGVASPETIVRAPHTEQHGEEENDETRVAGEGKGEREGEREDGMTPPSAPLTPPPPPTDCGGENGNTIELLSSSYASLPK